MMSMPTGQGSRMQHSKAAAAYLEPISRLREQACQCHMSA